MRKYYLDNIRWITVVLVVIYHVIYMFNGVIPELAAGPFHPVQYQDAVQYLLYPWFMVILFVVAGISSRYALEKYSDREFLIARTNKLLVPSTIGLLVFHWIDGYVSMCITGSRALSAEIPALVRYFIYAVSGTGVLWFIQMLWIYSLLLFFIHKFESGKLYRFTEKTGLAVLILLMIPLWASAQILNTPVIPVYRFGIYGLAFFIGYFIMAHDGVAERLSRYYLPLSVVAAVMGIAYSYYYFGENYTVEPVVNSPFSIVYGWVAVLAIFSLAKRFGNRSSSFTIWMSRHSFGLYVFHYLTLSAAALWICKENHLPAFPSYIAAGMAAFGGGYLLTEVISRIPVLRWCVLGISKKKEKKDVS